MAKTTLAAAQAWWIYWRYLALAMGGHTLLSCGRSVCRPTGSAANRNSRSSVALSKLSTVVRERWSGSRGSRASASRPGGRGLGGSKPARVGCRVGAWPTSSPSACRCAVMQDCLQVRLSSPDPRRAHAADLLRSRPLGVLADSDASVTGIEVLATLVDELCAAAPTVMVIDDLQWADDASLIALAPARHLDRPAKAAADRDMPVAFAPAGGAAGAGGRCPPRRCGDHARAARRSGRGRPGDGDGRSCRPGTRCVG